MEDSKNNPLDNKDDTVNNPQPQEITAPTHEQDSIPAEQPSSSEQPTEQPTERPGSLDEQTNVIVSDDNTVVEAPEQPSNKPHEAIDGANEEDNTGNGLVSLGDSNSAEPETLSSLKDDKRVIIILISIGLVLVIVCLAFLLLGNHTKKDSFNNEGNRTTVAQNSQLDRVSENSKESSDDLINADSELEQAIGTTLSSIQKWVLNNNKNISSQVDLDEALSSEGELKIDGQDVKVVFKEDVTGQDLPSQMNEVWVLPGYKCDDDSNGSVIAGLDRDLAVLGRLSSGQTRCLN